MSPEILKEDLKNIKKIIMIYKDKSTIKQIASQTKIQSELWKMFNLEKIKNVLTLH
jgi:hypothetical protein